MKPHDKSRAKSQSHSLPSNQSPESLEHSASTSRENQLTTFDTVVNEGDMITFGPTGEQLKIAKIDGETITIEKLP